MRADELVVPAGDGRQLTPAEIDDALAADPEVTLISDYLAGALGAEAAAGVERRLRDDAGFRARVAPIVEAWEGWPGPEAFIESEGELAASWERFLMTAARRRTGDDATREVTRARGNEGDGNRRAVRRLRRWQLAAALLLAVGLPLASWVGATVWPRLTAPALMVDEAPAREWKTVIVGERSWVSLAPGGRLTWRSQPGETGVRELWVDGDAHFRLATLTGGQYVVLTPSARVLVTGTEFNVEMVDPSTTVVTVTHGTVIVESRGPTRHDPLQLAVGAQAQVTWGVAPRRVK